MTKEKVNSLTRGKFLQLSTRITLGLAGLLGLIGLVRYFSHQPETGPPSIYNLGPINDFPPNGKLIRLDIPAVIYRTGDKFQAYSLICTHLGCTLEEAPEGFACPCHGSAFSAEGAVLKGPAVDNLPPLEVEISEAGDLLVHRRGAEI